MAASVETAPGEPIARSLYTFYESVVRRRKTVDYLREYDAQQWLPPERVLEIQWRKLSALLEFCAENVPYYQKTWKELGLHWRDIRNLDDYRRLPVINKDVIREHYQDFVSIPWRGQTMRKATGGSTGKPFAFEYTRESYERRMAVMMRGYAWAGARLGVRTSHVWGGDVGKPSWAKKMKGRLYAEILRKHVMNSFYLTRQSARDFIRQIDSYKPHVIVGYVSALEVLAHELMQHPHAGWRPAGIITAAEMLTRQQREEIEAGFRAPVFHTYGCREFMLIGAECERHSGYHTSADHLVVELMASDGSRPADQSLGDLVVTDLHNFGMPFLRYANGDVAGCHDGRMHVWTRTSDDGLRRRTAPRPAANPRRGIGPGGILPAPDEGIPDGGGIPGAAARARSARHLHRAPW